MRSTAKRLAVAALFGLALAGLQARGDVALVQEEENPAAGGNKTTQPSAVPKEEEKEAGTGKPVTLREEPPVYYARDKAGRLVPLLGFAYEELQEFVRQKKAGENGAVQPRQYDLQQVVVAGEATDERAELTAVYKVRLNQPRSDDDPWVEVPLLAGGAVLSEPPEYEGSGEHVVRFNAAAGAYSVRLRGGARSEHQLTVKFYAPIKNGGGGRRLELELPAAAASRLSLKLPLRSAAVTTHTGAAMAEVKPLAGGQSEISAWGLGGALSLAWKEGANTVAAPTSRLEADGEILVRLDGRSVLFDATLSVYSRGEEFDRFQIKLPSEAKRVPSESTTTAYTLSGGMDDSGIVSVQLPQKTKGPVEVQLQAERPYYVANPNEVLELAGFEVIEAIPFRQSGHIAVVVAGDWQTTWGKLERVQQRQVEELPKALQQENEENKQAAAFEYFGQPASLTVRVAERKTHVSVEPEYVYDVGAERIELKATLKYVIRGAKAFYLDVELPGWVIDGWGEIGEEGGADIFDFEEAWADEGPLHRVPLQRGTTGKLKLTISAHRLLPSDATQVELTLPTPHADVVEPALVAVVLADNVRLRPEEDELAGLSRLSSAGNLKLPLREQPALVYRAEGGQAKFVAEIEPLPQTVTVDAKGMIDIHRDGVHVEQLFEYRVEHEPLDMLTLDVPRSFIEDNNWELLLNGDPLPRPSAPPDDDVGAATAIVQVPLPASPGGEFTVTVRHQQPLDRIVMEMGEPLRVPLVMPLGAALASSRLMVTRESTLRIWPADEDWTLEKTLSGDGADSSPGLQLLATQALPDVQLDVSRAQRRSGGNTKVDRAWVQTWLGGSVRQDRAAYRLTSPEEQLQITLPEGVSSDNLEIRLDGQPVLAQLDSKGTYTVQLPGQASSAGRHVLELKYQFADAGGDTGPVEAQLPRFAGNVWVQDAYWQLVLPGNRHLVDAPLGLTPEFTWDWNGMGWERRSSREQAELEKWIGVQTEVPLPSSTNRYLFRLVGGSERLAVWSARRGEIVFVVSLAVLLVGLLLMYVRALRRPITLFVGGVIVAALAVWHAESALLFVQAAILGLALVLLAFLLRYAQTRQRAAPMIVRSAGSSIIEPRSTQAPLRPAEPAPPASTESVPVEMEMPTADSHSR